MAGRADCRQVICRKCAVNVQADDGAVPELTCGALTWTAGRTRMTQQTWSAGRWRLCSRGRSQGECLVSYGLNQHTILYSAGGVSRHTLESSAVALPCTKPQAPCPCRVPASSVRCALKSQGRDDLSAAVPSPAAPTPPGHYTCVSRLDRIIDDRISIIYKN